MSAEKYTSKHSGTTIDNAVDQVSDVVLASLQTTNKNVVGAINEIKNNKQDQLTPGNGININNNIISSNIDVVLEDEE